MNPRHYKNKMLGMLHTVPQVRAQLNSERKLEFLAKGRCDRAAAHLHTVKAKVLVELLNEFQQPCFC